MLYLIVVRTNIADMTDKIKKAGRPVKEKKASSRVEFRAEDDRKEHWLKYAEAHGFKSLSAWLKQIADEKSGFNS